MIVLPIPGELAEGHLSRIRRLTGMASRRKTLNYLGCPSLVSYTTPSNYYAKYAGMDPDIYISNHGIPNLSRSQCSIPLKRRQTLEISIIGVEYSTKVGNSRVARAKFCRACINHDTVRYGFSWFHREHYVDHVCWCIEHDQPLDVVWASDIYSYLPSEISKQTCNNQQKCTITALKSGLFLANFAIATLRLLTTAPPMLIDAIDKLLSNRVIEMGLEDDREMTEYVYEMVPKEWLEKFAKNLDVPSSRYGFHSYIVSSEIEQMPFFIAILYPSWGSFYSEYQNYADTQFRVEKEYVEIHRLKS